MKINRREKLRTNLYKSTEFVCSSKRNALISELIRTNETRQTVYIRSKIDERALTVIAVGKR